MKYSNPQSVAITTATFYPDWYLGKASAKEIDKVRGDLALRMIDSAKMKGFQIIVVDGGDNKFFKKALSNLGIHPLSEKQKGMSASRQQAFKAASNLKQVQVICWVEPEKVSIITDCLPTAIFPILEGKADIIVPRRNRKLFKKTYPDYQFKFEQESNRIWNDLLKKYGLRSNNDPELDVWFGPKFFRNDPQIVSCFTDQYSFKANLKSPLNKIVKPELWANAVFFPVISALHKGNRVIDLEVLYKHPKEQTYAEQDNAEIRKKRKFQQKSIILASEFFIRMLLHLKTEGGRIEKVI